MATRKKSKASTRKPRSSSPRTSAKHDHGRRAGSGHPDPDYLALIRRFPLRPIRTEAELDAASDLIDELTDRDDLSSSELDYLDVLGDLVEKYEDETVEMPHVSDAEMLQSLITENEVRQAELVRRIGISQSALTLVLKGKRALTQEHIEALSKYFGVNPATFLDSSLPA